MTNDTALDSSELGCTVLDPSLRRWQRRYFYQPPVGRGRRAITARRAQRGWPLPAGVVRLTERWDDARERETVARGRARWI